MKNKTQPETATPVLIRKPDACKRYGISLRFLDDLIAEGAIPTRKLGRRCCRIPVAAADKFFLGEEATK